MKHLIAIFLVIILSIIPFWGTYAEEISSVPLFVNTSDGKLVLKNDAERSSDASCFDGAYPFDNGLSIVICNGYYGVINLQGHEIVPCKYESIAVYDHAIVAGLDDRYILMNLLGEPVTDTSYQMIYDNGYGFVISCADQFGLIDSAGNRILDMEWINIGGYCDGWMQLVDSNGSCNYINANKELLLDRWADWSTYFSNGYAAFGIDNNIYITDAQGNLRQTDFTDIDLFPTNGLFLAKDANGTAGLYDAAKDTFTICSIGMRSVFSDNMIAIRCGNKWGYCNGTGEIVIEPIYDEVRDFSEGFAPVRLGNTWTYIDPFGVPLNATTYAQAYEFREGYAACVDLANGKLGFIDQSGQWIIAPEFPITHAVYFQNGICNLGAYDPWKGYFIDKQGTTLWQFQLDIDYFD